MKVFQIFALVTFWCFVTVSHSTAATDQQTSPTNLLTARDSNGLQDIVTWDKYSMSVNGERLYVYSGEFHPWRLPVIDLWLDILQKLKALGYNAVSIYVHWGLVEAQQGVFNFDGIFDWEPFFAAVKKAGLYVIARPGPYINAELSAGGFPGWRQHAPEGIYWRVSSEAYYKEITPYLQEIGKRLAPHQITNGGSIILLQLENELSNPAAPGYDWPANGYMKFLRDEFNNAGINVPLIHNDVAHFGYYAPGTGVGAVDVYTYDYYPLPCSGWTGSLSQSNWDLHLSYAPGNPHFLGENGGGFYAQWSDTDSSCPTFLDALAFRALYKNLYSMSVTAMNIYMIYGGTNWGHLSWHRTPTTYDFTTAISENRDVTREKYSEMKLQAHFFAVSPAFLTTRLTVKTTTQFTDNPNVVVSCTKDEVGGKTAFWVTRHSNSIESDSRQYTLTVPTSKGNVTIPQLSGELTLPGKDSRIHLTDYQIGPYNLLYSSAEIFTWQKIGNNYYIIFYGSPQEVHESAFVYSGSPLAATVLEGNELLNSKSTNDTIILNYNTTGQTVVSLGSDIKLYLLDKYAAYKFWVPTLSSGGNGSVIVKGPYLVREAWIDNNTLHLSGDVNATTPIEVIAPAHVNSLSWNNVRIPTTRTKQGSLVGVVRFVEPTIAIPDLRSLEWKSINSLPEIGSEYDDSKWVSASNTTTVNGARGLTTPTDLYSGTYGFHTGYILYRGHFTAGGGERQFYVQIGGGWGFGFSVWLNDAHIGSYTGEGSTDSGSGTFAFSGPLAAGSENVLTIIYQQMGYNENESGGITEPRGIWNYNFVDVTTPNVTWKIQGNHGGENYADKARGPYNEGGTWAERKGYHQPGVDTTSWSTLSPFNGTTTAGIQFYRTTFDLKFPSGYDIPLSFNLTASANSRALFFVNGYQFGRYIGNFGPQHLFPVPEGILNYRGTNTVSIVIWDQGDSGAYVTEFSVGKTGVYQTGLGKIASSPQPSYSDRGAF